MLCFERPGLTLSFEERTGVIASLRDGSREYVGEPVPVFLLSLRTPAGEQQRLGIPEMKFVRCVKGAAAMEAVYSGCGVTVTVHAAVTDRIAWRIDVSVPEDRVLEWVDFPRLAVPNDLRGNGGTSQLLWGFNEGGIVDDIAYKESYVYRFAEPSYPSQPTMRVYPAIVQTQFVAYFNETDGLYFAAHDPQDHLKGIDFFPCGRGIMLHMRHYCGMEFAQRYEMPFPMVMEFFQGGWQDAAERYRTWMESAKAGVFTPIPENSRLPAWYGESPVVVAYPVRGHHDGDVMDPNGFYPYLAAMDQIRRLEEVLDSRILVLLMHWEGSAPWAPPYAWPPYGGEEALKAFIDALHRRGDLLGLYCSGIGWTQFSRRAEYHREQEFEEKNLRSVMCLSPKQELPYSAVVPGIRTGYDMCPTQPFTVAVMRDQVEQMAGAGVDYIQLMDQQHGGTSYFCYSRSHGHPPVPGRWQVEAMQHLLETVQIQSGQVLLGCESAAAESYLPYLLFSDNRFHLNYYTGRPVPVYAYLFHEYVNNFMGNQVWVHDCIDHKKSPVNVLERLGYAFSAGDMLTLVIDDQGRVIWDWGWEDPQDVPDQESILTFVRNANGWRRGAGKKYLHTGRMRKPWDMECGENRIMGVRGYELHLPKLHTSAWQAKDGSIGQFLINYNPEDAACTLHLPEGNYRIRDLENGSRTVCGGARNITVRKLSVILIEGEEIL